MVGIILLIASVSLLIAMAQTGATDIVLYASEATVKTSQWQVISDSTAAGGACLSNSDLGATKVTTAFASPASYFEMTFTAQTGTAYRLWIRGKAASNSPYNDSVYAQFSGSVDSTGNPIYRIGTTSGAAVNIEDCSGCGLSGWGWQDNGWGIGVNGPLIYFQAGAQTIRVQTREDGLAIDQIVLSATTYKTISPGTLTNDTVILPKTGDTTGAKEVVIWASDIPGGAIFGRWSKGFNSSAAGQTAIRNPDLGAAKVTTPLASPADYFEMTFNAQEDTPYRLWIRGRADNDSPYNDSVYVQFSGSVDAGGGAIYRIGTQNAATVNLEDCSGCTVSKWGWQDTGWGTGVFGPLIYFQATGRQTIRLQTREDGLSIDQIVLSSQKYLNSFPGSLRDDATILPSTVGVALPSNQPPQVSISATPTSGIYPLLVSFSADAVDPDGYIASYNWTFGDGQIATSILPTNLYLSAGSFTARLTVTDNSGATASASRTITVSAPPPPTGSTVIKVLDWNIQFGKGTDNVYNLDRTATYIANMGPHIVTLCEVERRSGDDQAQRLADLLRQKTGVTWYFHFTPKYQGIAEGNLILSRFPLSNTASLFLSYQRSVAKASVTVNGALINIFATHLDPDSASRRTQEITELRNWASGFTGAAIVAGDFNAWPGAGEITGMTSWCYDGWVEAVSASSATAYPDNPVDPVNTRTRRARIDYVFHTQGATSLFLRSAQVPDIRDLTKTPVELLGTADDRGVRPSDHNMSIMTFEVR